MLLSRWPKNDDVLKDGIKGVLRAHFSPVPPLVVFSTASLYVNNPMFLKESNRSFLVVY